MDPYPHQSQNSGAVDGGSKWSHGGLWTLTVEAWRLKVAPVCQWWQICITLMRIKIQPDPDPHQSGANPQQGLHPISVPKGEFFLRTEGQILL
jgi:hypothetical protein